MIIDGAFCLSFDSPLQVKQSEEGRGIVILRKR